ncbi:Hypothetical predicted protein [Olea europaea subsp. europaea]|uniref:Cryptochrome C-terminal domain-containing protein n=1 Tax=Olea europaea subsp. europaea TaxID=158383 RepID=A0A8S0R117_OLEEU|nr:Hypothetical predicted protein [Olea europaea subsp. europaea]
MEIDAASRSAIENRMEEGLGDTSESAPWDFLKTRKWRWTMNLSETTLFDDEETSTDHRNVADDSRAEVPINVNVNVTEEPREPHGHRVMQTVREILKIQQHDHPVAEEIGMGV